MSAFLCALRSSLFSWLMTLQNQVEQETKHINQILKIDQLVNEVINDRLPSPYNLVSQGAPA